MTVRDPFAGAARTAARQLRRMPAELRKAAGKDVRDRVAEPLAAAVRAAYQSAPPYGPVLAGNLKVRVNTEPVIVSGGAKRLVSGGGSGRNLVYGHEFGSGTVPQRRERAARRAANGAGRQGSRQRGSTAQFAGPGKHSIFGTFAREADTTYQNWLGVLDPFLTEWENGGG